MLVRVVIALELEGLGSLVHREDVGLRVQEGVDFGGLDLGDDGRTGVGGVEVRVAGAEEGGWPKSAGGLGFQAEGRYSGRSNGSQFRASSIVACGRRHGRFQWHKI